MKDLVDLLDLVQEQGKMEMERETRAIPNDHGLTQLLFSWSLEDIYNEDLYGTQVLPFFLSLSVSAF